MCKFDENSKLLFTQQENFGREKLLLRITILLDAICGKFGKNGELKLFSVQFCFIVQVANFSNKTWTEKLEMNDFPCICGRKTINYCFFSFSPAKRTIPKIGTKNSTISLRSLLNIWSLRTVICVSLKCNSRFFLCFFENDRKSFHFRSILCQNLFKWFNPKCPFGIKLSSYSVLRAQQQYFVYGREFCGW